MLQFVELHLHRSNPSVPHQAVDFYHGDSFATGTITQGVAGQGSQVSWMLDQTGKVQMLVKPGSQPTGSDPASRASNALHASDLDANEQWGESWFLGFAGEIFVSTSPREIGAWLSESGLD